MHNFRLSILIRQYLKPEWNCVAHLCMALPVSMKTGVQDISDSYF